MVSIIDLSIPIEDSLSEPLPVKVSHETHQQSVERMKGFFGCTEHDLPQGLGWANDSVTLGAPAGTYVDAPWHYAPTSEGEKAANFMKFDSNIHGETFVDLYRIFQLDAGQIKEVNHGQVL